MPLTTRVAAYQVCTRNFLHCIFLVGLGVDGTVVADGVDLLPFPSNLGDSVTLGVLELLNELVHDIDENNLQESLANTLCQCLRGKGVLLLPQSQTDRASRQRSHGQCSHPRSEQL